MKLAPRLSITPIIKDGTIRTELKIINQETDKNQEIILSPDVVSDVIKYLNMITPYQYGVVIHNIRYFPGYLPMSSVVPMKDRG